MTTEYKTISLTQDESIWTLTINRPDALNALNSTVLIELAEGLRFISELPFEAARGLILTGSGAKSFVAGADIKEISELTEDSARLFAQKGQSVFYELGLLKIPVVAAVNGFALGGGCELALSCDFIFASDNAKFGLPEVSLGVIPGFGGTVRLSRAVGMRRARQMIFSGEMVSAAEALQIGLVNKVTTAEELIPAVKQYLKTTMTKSPLAIASAKNAILRAWDLELEAASELEVNHFSTKILKYSSHDIYAGIMSIKKTGGCNYANGIFRHVYILSLFT